jgi:choline dehydrogenase-like flavoprotein
MPHLAYTGGIVVLLNQSIDPKFFHPNNLHIRDGRSLRYIRTFSLSENTRRERHLPSLRFALYPPDADTMEIIRKNSSTRQMKDLGEPLSARVLVARINAEQLPNPASRITLSQERDALGMQAVLIDWQLTAKDKDAMVAAHRLFGAELGRVGLGRYQSLVPQDEGSWPDDMVGNGHTMGTTRMHRDPRYGVVDENCRVHGMQNLYVAGSSVFPTAGSFNPTLTLVALALRLADHVKEAPI